LRIAGHENIVGRRQWAVSSGLRKSYKRSGAVLLFRKQRIKEKGKRVKEKDWRFEAKDP